MAKFLVIVESPKKSKTISKILGKDYQVLASCGHIQDLPKSKIGVDLEDFEMTYEVSKGKEKILKELQTAANKAEKVFLCSDDDREGEFISFSLKNLLGLKKSEYARAAFCEITPKAITNAIANPRDIDPKLVDSQQARRALDRIVGYKISPILWEKIQRGLSAGRVQSVAVKIIVDREREILAFVPEEYWTMATDFSIGKANVKSSLRLLDGEKVVTSADDLEKSKSNKGYSHISAKQQADLIKSKIEKRPYLVTMFETRQVSEKPYPPFHTSSLQMASASRLGYDSKKTMQVAQGLYEGVQIGAEHVGLITYMRTDSFSISQDALGDCRTLIGQEFGNEYLPATPNFYRAKAGAQAAHECIRPTDVRRDPDSIRGYVQSDMYRLYKLIWDRFVACQMTPAIYDASTMEAETSDKTKPVATFRSTGRVVKFPGWTKVYGQDEGDDSKSIPVVAVGTKANVGDIAAEQHYTQPPPRYNDATIVKVLEKEGIGRPSTYASIIQTIQDRKYVEKQGKGGRASFRATDMGMVVTDGLLQGFPKIMDLGFTRGMEEDLDKIEEGTRTYIDVMREFWKEFEVELKAAKKKMSQTKGGKETSIPCPACGTKMLQLLSSLGFFLKCPAEKCGESRNLDGSELKTKAQNTGLTCDKCGGNVVKASGRFGPYYACENYKAKKCTLTMKCDKKGLPQRRLEPVKSGVKCEKCEKEMLIRVASRKKAPNAFLSCSGFPRCRATGELPANLDGKGKELIAEFHKIRTKDANDALKLAAFNPDEQVEESKETFE